MRLEQATDAGEIIIRAKKIIRPNNHEMVTIKLDATNINRRDESEAPNPFIEIYKSLPTDVHELVYKTEVRLLSNSIGQEV